jgi:DNA-binding NarL/FixJ family response regulator
MLALLVDDHALMRDGLALLMRHRFAQVRLLQAASLEEACACLAAEPGIELVLLDLKLGDSHGVESVTRLRAEAPEATLVVMSSDERHDTVRAAIRAGASGYIPKTTRGGAIEHALRAVLDGQIYLPPAMLQAQLMPLTAHQVAQPATALPATSQRQPVERWQGPARLWPASPADRGLAPMDTGFGPIAQPPARPAARPPARSPHRPLAHPHAVPYASPDVNVQGKWPADAPSPDAHGRLARVDVRAVEAAALKLGLAPRQVDVFKPMLEGASNKAIARELDLAESTVKSHTIAIFRKFGVASRAEAMVMAAQLGLYISAWRDSGQY